MSTSIWKGLTGDWGEATKWTGGVPDGTTADALIDAAGTYGVTVAAAESFTVRNLTLDDPGATLSVAGTLNLTNRFNLDAGTLALSGSIVAGTIAANGALTRFDGGTLDHVRWLGTMDLSPVTANPPNANTLTVTNGLKVLDAAGTGPGLIYFRDTSYYPIVPTPTLNFSGTQTLDNVTIDAYAINIGSVGENARLVLGSNVDIRGFVSFDGTIVNYGTIGDADLPSAFWSHDAFINAGTMNVSTFEVEFGASFINRAGATLNIALGSYNFYNPQTIRGPFSNSGLLTLTTANPYYSVSFWDNVTNTATGVVDVSHIAVSVQGNLINDGSVTVDAGGLQVGDLINDGSIDVGAGSALVVDGYDGRLINRGTIDVENGSISLGAHYSNQGTLTINNSTFIFNGYFSYSFIDQYKNKGNTFGIETYLDNTGHTLTAAPGIIKGELEGFGTIKGGTISDAAGGNFSFKGGTLDGVTYRGPMVISHSPYRIDVEHGLTLRNAAGTGPGSLKIESSLIAFSSDQTVDNATVTLVGAELDIFDTLTLGPTLAIEIAGSDYVRMHHYGDGAIANQGTIEVQAGGRLQIDGGLLQNSSGTTFAGGRYVVDAGATFYLPPTTRIETDAADITLDGIDARLGATFTSNPNSTFITLEKTLKTVASDGALHVLGGRGFVGTLALVDNGLIELAGGTFKEGSLTVGAGGTFTGHGTLAAPKLINQGSVEAGGGTLDVTGVVTGTGSFDIGAGARLEFASSVASGILVDLAGSSSTLALDTPLSFKGTVAGFGTGDTIDLVGTTATSLVYVATSNKLFVRNGTTTVAALQLSGSYSKSNFALTESGGDSLITFVGAAASLDGLVQAVAGFGASGGAAPQPATPTHDTSGDALELANPHTV